MDSVPEQEKLIDLKKFISSKNKTLGKLIPSFIYKRLGKFLHVDGLNKVINDNKDLYGPEFATGLIKYFNVNLIIEGIENLANERNIVAANHPLGGMDGLALISVIGDKLKKDIIFPVNDALWMITNLRSIFVRINKYGSNRDNVKNLLDMFAGDKTILYFPAGLCSRRRKDKTIMDLEWKSTVITQAKKNKRNIIPTFVDGCNTPRFYNIANRRKKLGLKINIEQLYLPDEGFKYANKDLRIVFGKPIPYSYWDDKHNDSEWAEILKEQVYKLK